MKKVTKVLMIVIALATLCTSVRAGAQSNGLGITPRKDYTIKAGDKISDNLFVNNLSPNQDLHVGIRIVDFSAQDETGTPKLNLADNAAQTAWSLKPFIKLPADVTVKGGKSVYIPFTISIPAGHGAGSYYSAIEYTAENAQTKQKVNITASTASLIFVTVPGKAHEQLTFKQFGTFVPNPDDQGGAFTSMFVTGQPKVLAYRLTNQGNVAEQPNGSIIIKNMFGKQVRTIEKANPKNALALLGQTRRFEVCIKEARQDNIAVNGQTNPQTACKNPGLAPGHYTAELGVFYGLNGNNTQEVTATASFWYLPLWFVILVAAVLTLLGVFIALLGKKFGQSKAKTKHKK